MIITITVEDEFEGQRLLVQKKIMDVEIDYASFDLVCHTVSDLRRQIQEKKNPPFKNA